MLYYEKLHLVSTLKIHRKNFDHLMYFILKICITHFQTMAVLISLVIKAALESWSVYFKDTTTYLTANACMQIFMGIEIVILFLSKKRKDKIFFT